MWNLHQNKFSSSLFLLFPQFFFLYLYLLVCITLPPPYLFVLLPTFVKKLNSNEFERGGGGTELYSPLTKGWWKARQPRRVFKFFRPSVDYWRQDGGRKHVDLLRAFPATQCRNTLSMLHSRHWHFKLGNVTSEIYKHARTQRGYSRTCFKTQLSRLGVQCWVLVRCWFLKH